MTDFTIRNEGSIVLLMPQTEEADAWVEARLPADALTWGGAIAIEPRYVAAILQGISVEE